MRLLFAIVLIALALLLVGILLLVRPAWSATRCTTSEEQTLGRVLSSLTVGTRAVNIYNKTLSRWESTITPPPQGRPARGI